LDKRISTGAQYVTPDSKIYCEKSQNVPVLAQEIGFVVKAISSYYQFTH
jgi:hypothetical protein